MFDLYVCCVQKIEMSKFQSVLTALIWATSTATITTVTYICSTAFALFLILLHYELMDKIKQNEKINGALIKIGVIYLFAYVGHYTNAIVLGSLSVAMLLYMLCT